MGILLILLLVAVIAVYVNRQKAPEMATPVLYGLVVLIFIVAGTRMFRVVRPRSTSDAMAASEAFDRSAVYRLGQAVAQDLPSGSTVLVIHGGAFHETMQRRLDSRIESLKQGLGSGYTVNIEGRTEMSEDDADLDEPHLSGGLLMQYLSRHTGTNAVVSFIGAPHFRQFPAAGSVPPLYVMGGMDDDVLRGLMQRGVVAAGVAYRASGVDWDARPQRGMSQEDVFNLRFELLRPSR